jgi:antitoxin VapB
MVRLRVFRTSRRFKLGNSGLVSPVGQRWDEFFVNGPRASEDFMSECEQLSPEEREPL